MELLLLFPTRVSWTGGLGGLLWQMLLHLADDGWSPGRRWWLVRLATRVSGTGGLQERGVLLLPLLRHEDEPAELYLTER